MAFDALADPHSNAKSWYAYDRYIDYTMGVEVEGGFCSISKYRSNNPVVITTTSSTTSAVPSAAPSRDLKYQVVGDWIKRKPGQQLAPDTTKRFISCLIDGVQGVLREGNCFDQFGEENVLVTPEGEAKFTHIGIISFSHHAERVMYECTVKVIKLFLHGCQIPADIEDLLSLMHSQQKKELYRIHPAILPHSDRSTRYLNLYEYVKHVLTDPEKKQILLKLINLEFVKNWRRTVRQNQVLLDTYNFIPGSYEQKQPCDDKGNPTTPWTELEQQLQSVELLLDFIRNGISHRLQRVPKVTPHEHETILSVYFLLLLPKLQEAVFDVLKSKGLRYLGLD